MTTWVLHLHGKTSDAWLQNALEHLDDVVVDHAHCEHKAAVTALSFVSKYFDDPLLIVELGTLARDEAGHFAEMATLCTSRGLSLGHPEPDPYVKQLLSAAKTSSPLASRVDRLLCCAIIEGRSCERLQMLAKALPAHKGARLGTGIVDDDVCALYDRLWREEAGHHLLFIDLAERSFELAGEEGGTEKTAQRLSVLAAHEGALLASLPIRAAIH